MPVAKPLGRGSQRGIVGDAARVPFEIDFRELAARLRALLQPALGSTSVRATAGRLHVSPRALRASIERGSPRPSSAVVLAVVQHYGVDPTWLLTGEYSSSTHRESLEDPTSVVRLLARTALRNDLLDRRGLLSRGDLVAGDLWQSDGHAGRAD